MSDLSTLKLFATHPHPCSYLKGEEATTVFIDPDAKIDQSLYSQLSQLGFRRSGAHLYRPQCSQCRACISCRIPVNEFTPDRSQTRCIKRNQDLSIAFVTQINADEHYALYERYINTRHRDGDMYPPSRAQYDAFLTREWEVTEFVEFRQDGELIAVAVCDSLQDGLSAVYTFYNPAYESRGLGKLAVLTQIHTAAERGLEYLYLGYWIRDCEKMRYKTDYAPLELLINQRWMRLNR